MSESVSSAVFQLAVPLEISMFRMSAMAGRSSAVAGLI
jgi:hypothetical protein